MKENQKKAFDFAADTTKQLIGISTGIIALMVTFSKDIIGNSLQPPKELLAWTWGVFIASIIFGILTLMALTGTLQPMKPKVKKNEDKDESEKSSNLVTNSSKVELDINNKNIRILSLIQILLFVAAIILTVVFGFESLNENPELKKNKGKIMIIRKSTLNNDTSTIYVDTLYIDK